MARAFKRRQGGYVAGLSADERAVLAWLMNLVLTLLEPPEPAAQDSFEQMLAEAGLAVGEAQGDREPDPASEDASAPAALDGGIGADLDDPHRDPALDRLLPDAHRDDPTLAAEFRRLVGPGLRATKAANLAAAIAVLDAAEGSKLVLDDAGARAFAVALTDVRLVLGERLGVRDDEDMALLERQAALGQVDEEQGWLLGVYDFLTWLQESLTVAMLRGLT